jgi:hypothetical protein
MTTTAVTVGCFVTAFIVALIVADYPDEGPILVAFSDTHGIHVGDLVLVAVWVMMTAGLVAIWRRWDSEGR